MDTFQMKELPIPIETLWMRPQFLNYIKPFLSRFGDGWLKSHLSRASHVPISLYICKINFSPLLAMME